MLSGKVITIIPVPVATLGNMTSPLIPTVITDKNGKITTVHKKPSRGSEKEAVMPAPKIAAKAATRHTQALEAITEKVVKAFTLVESSRLSAEERTAKVRRIVEAYPDELVNRLADHFDTPAHGHYFVASAIYNETPESFVSEMLTYGPYFQTDDDAIAGMFLRSLHHCKQLPPMNDYGTAPKDVMSQCIALLTVMEMIDYHQYHHSDAKMPLKYNRSNDSLYEGHMEIEGDALIDLILEKPDQAEYIAEIIIERDMGDAELIRDILNQEDSTALNSGVL